MPPRFHASIKLLTDETGLERVTALASNVKGTFIASMTESKEEEDVVKTYASLLSSHDCFTSVELDRPKIPSSLSANVTAVAVYSLLNNTLVACGYSNGHVEVFMNGVTLIGTSHVSISEYDEAHGGFIGALKFLPTFSSSDDSIMMRIVAVTKAGELILLDATPCLDVTSSTTKADEVTNNESSFLLGTNSTDDVKLTDSSTVMTLSMLSLIRLPSHSHKPTEVPLSGSLAVGGTNTLSNGFSSPFVAVGMSEGSIIVLGDKVTEEQTMDLVVLETIVVPSGPTCLAFSNNQVTLLAAGLKDGEVAFMDALSTGTSLPSFEIFYFLKSSTQNAVTALAFSVTSSYLAIASGHTLCVMDGSTFEIFYRFSTRNRSSITSVIYAEDNKLIVSRKDGVTDLVHMRCWDQLLGDALYTPHTINHLTFASAASNKKTREESRMVVASGSDLLLYETDSWNKPQTKSYSIQSSGKISIAEPILKTAYSPNAKYIAAASHDTDNHEYNINLHTMSNNEVLHKQTLSNLPSIVIVISFSPCSNYLMVGTAHGIFIYDLTTHSDSIFENEDNLVFKNDEESVSCACWASDETMIAVGYTDEVKIYSRENNDYEEIESIPVQGSDVAFNTECTTLAIGTRSGTIVIAKKDDSVDDWIQDEVKRRGSVTSLQFSTDLPSSFLMTTGSNNSCQVYSCKGKRYLLVQDIESSEIDQISCFSLDPAGNTLVMGGTSSLYGNEGGALMAVRVGELLRADWFPLAFAYSKRDSFTPELACQKLSELGSIDRAQLLFHRPLDIQTDVGFMIETAIRRFLRKRSKDNMTSTLGSAQIKATNHSIEVMQHLRAILETFPLCIFATTSRHGTSIFDIALRRKDPSLLRLTLKTALSSCKAYPYLLMNDTLRGGHITKILIQASQSFPQEISDAILHHLEWWPSISMSSKKPFYLQGPSIKYQPHKSPDVKKLFQENTISDNQGALALPMLYPIPGMISVEFLSAIAYNCPLEVFSKAELKILIDYLWNSHIRSFFFVDFFLYLVFTIVWGSLATMFFRSLEVTNEMTVSMENVSPNLVVAVFAFNVLLGIKELVEYLFSHEYEIFRRSIASSPWMNISLANRRFESRKKLITDFCKFCISKYYKNQWDLCGCLAWWMVNVTILVYLMDLPAILSEVSAITTLLILTKLISYLRAFDQTVWILKVLDVQYNESVGFFTILGCIILGMAFVFQLLLAPYHKNLMDYETTWYYTLDMAISGNPTIFDIANEHKLNGLNQFLVLCISLFLGIGIFVIALSGYIAILIDAHNELKKNQVAHLSQEKARMVVKYLALFPNSHWERIATNMEYFICLVHFEHEERSENVQEILSNLQKREEFFLKSCSRSYLTKHSVDSPTYL